MTVKVTKPAVNLREELADLRKPTGIAGEAMLRAETPQEQFNLIGAGRRNLIINGDMRIAQRGTSFSAPANGTYTLDRFPIYQSALFLNVAQDSDAPSGFANSLKTTVNTANPSPSSTDISRIGYVLEAQDVSRLNYGSTNAQTMTLSFWVKSTVAADYTVFVYVDDAARSIVKGYTINTANTWEYKTITIAGDTSGSGINNDNGVGIYFEFNLMAGPSYNAAGYQDTWSGGGGVRASGQTANCTTSGATWQITGVQLELGKVATPFEHRSYGEELAACQRYFEIFENTASGFRVSGVAYSTTDTNFALPFLVEKRATPTITMTNNGQIYRNAAWRGATGSSVHGALTRGCSISIEEAGNLTAGSAYFIRNYELTVDAEL
jgi:hypothetical protein